MNINEVIQKHPAFNHASEIEAICSPLKALGITYFSHARIDSDNRLSGICNVPDFLKLYFLKGYYNYDVHMANAPHGETYRLGDTQEYNKTTKLIFDDFLSFGNGHIFSIIQNHKNGTDYYHFATKLGNESINGKYLALIEPLKKFIQHFREKIQIQPALAKCYDLTIPLRTESGEFQINDTKIDTDYFENLLTNKRHFLPDSDEYLTQREIECLFWLSKGKTFAEVALIIGITERTIKAHVTAAREKTNCRNQFQLGALFAKLL